MQKGTYTDIDTFLRYFDNVHKRTARLLPLVPEGGLELTPSPHNFSFGDIFRHLASVERNMFVAIAVGEENNYKGHQKHFADGHEAVKDYYDTLHQEAIEKLATLTNDDLPEKCITPAGASMSRSSWLRAMIEHEIHHRGQLYLMLSMVGVTTPPIFGLTSEDLIVS